MTTLSIRFDPYRDWLQVTEPDRPPHPYQLLGLTPLESNLHRIRAALERQLAALDDARCQADEELRVALREEVETAGSILLDGERKALLDARLKRKIGTTTSAGCTPPPSAAGLKIQCTQCGRENSGQRRFCGDCGSPLWEKCNRCGAEVSADERFCGGCGVDVRSALAEESQRLDERLTEARTLGAASQFDAALEILRPIAVLEDPKFDRWAQAAADLMEEYERTKRTGVAEAARNYEQAQAAFRQHAFENAVTLLQAVPAVYRDAAWEDFYRRCDQARREVLKLSGEIREAVAAKTTAGLLAKIERLLQLKPNFAQATRLAEQLRDQVLRRARHEWAKHRYRATLDILSELPAFCRNEEANSLREQAEELDLLLHSVRTSPILDDATRGLVRRLSQTAGSNPEVIELAAKMSQWKNQPAADSRSVVAAWSPAPSRTRFGVPIEPLGRFSRLRGGNEATNAALDKTPGRYFTAAGLALQGLERSAVSINLMPAERRPLLGKLSLPFRKRATKTAWGLDLSATGLKAVKLSADETTGDVVVAAVAYIPHEKLLTHPDAETDRGRMIKATLQRFTAEHTLDGAKIVGSISSRTVLGRFFDLPPMPAKKVADAVAFEAKHQVPIPPEDLTWSYQIQDPADERQADSAPRKILLVAARNFHVKERLSYFKDGGIPLDILAAEPTALHNAIAYEWFGDNAPNKLSPEGAVIALDVGADGTQCVVSLPKFCWFRGVNLAGNDFTQALVKRFKLTYDQAEQWKIDPAQARRFTDWRDALQPLFQQATAELERTVDAYQKLDGVQPIRRICGVGDAFQVHGLLKALRGGDS